MLDAILAMQLTRPKSICAFPNVQEAEFSRELNEINLIELIPIEEDIIVEGTSGILLNKDRKEGKPNQEPRTARQAGCLVDVQFLSLPSLTQRNAL